MARGSYQGYVEDSEEEEIMTFDTSALAAHGVAGPSFLPPPPPPGRPEETTVSSIQTPNFTDVQSTRAPPPPNQAPKDPDHSMFSAIQTPNFTVDRSVVSNISEFSPIPRPGPSNVQSAQLSKLADSSISTSASTSSAPRPRPRPRPAYKKKVVDAAPDTSFPTSSSSVSAPAAGGLLSTAPAPPHILALEPMGAPSHIPPPTATSLTAASKSTSGKARVSDSGVELDLLYAGDIAERAKLRSRARTQTQAKAAGTSLDDGVISLSSDDELQLLSPIKPKPKPKPKPKAKKASAGPSSGKDTGSGNSGKGKATVVIPPPSKRAKTTHLPDTGFESDVNTIPVPTSDFPAPAHIPGTHSSQLPPSDPPPSTATSSSARTHPHTSQEIEAAKGDRDLSPLSSPPPPMPRKRKRPSLPTALGLDSDVEAISGPAAGLSKPPAKAKPAVKELPVPPPLPSPSVVPETQPPVKPKPAARKKRKDPVEDNDEDWAGEAAPKPTKSRKKARVTDDDDFGGGGAGGGDDDDDAWDAPSAKGKAKGKKAAKKTAPKEKKGRAKAKDKEKPPKSKEIIEDSDEEGGGMLPPPVPAPTSKLPASKAASPPTAATEARPPASSDAASSKKGGPKGKQRAIVLSDEEDGDEANAADISTNTISADIDSPAVPTAKKGGRKSTGGQQSPTTETKENDAPASSTSIYGALAKPFATPAPSSRSNFSNANRSYTIGAKSTKHTPMSELIRRASAQPGSPFPATARPVYSPLVKGSKAVLRRIAPLHPNRRTPPPVPPRAPQPKKTKKMLELEEKWEMELEDSVEGWYAMADSERAALMRAKRDAELGIYED